MLKHTHTCYHIWRRGLYLYMRVTLHIRNFGWVTQEFSLDRCGFKNLPLNTLLIY